MFTEALIKKSKHMKRPIKDLKPYDGFLLSDLEIKFMDRFKDTHDYRGSLDYLEDENDKIAVGSALRLGDNEFSKCYLQYLSSAPTHPEVNKVVILNDLVKLKNMAFGDGDTALLMKVIPEINKMIKGNLANNTTSKSVTKLVGVIDLTKGNQPQIEEGKVIEIDEN